MNNNNRGNNRRRGRGNNRQQGGGQQINRIDSRARGNAPQMLEKYRKLAHDAHLNGDRVNEEYYLQFADHYFRVIADTRQRQEEQRVRREERWQEGGEAYREDADEQGEYTSETDDAFGQGRDSYPARRDDRPSRDDRPRREERDGGREARTGHGDAPPPSGDAGDADETAGGQPPHFEPADNPFTRDARGSRGLKPRREGEARRQPRKERQVASADDAAENADDGQFRFDPASLPPAIGASSEAPASPESAEVGEAEAPKPKRRTRKPKAAVDAADETLAPVSSD